MSNDFASKLIALRGDRNLTQQELGQSAGVSPSQISRYEAGLARPRKTVLRKLASALGVDVNQLLANESDSQGGVELIFDVSFKNLGTIRCSLHFTEQQHRKMANGLTGRDENERQKLLGDLMLTALSSVPMDSPLSTVTAKENPITRVTGRFSAADDYLDDIRGDQVFAVLHPDLAQK